MKMRKLDLSSSLKEVFTFIGLFDGAVDLSPSVTRDGGVDLIAQAFAGVVARRQ